MNSKQQMKDGLFTTSRKFVILLHLLAVLISIYVLQITSFAQTKIAILAPEKSDQSELVTSTLASLLSEKATILDSSLVESIFGYEGFERPYNLSSLESQRLGARIGCNFLILIKTDSFRRSSFEKNEYYESYAAFFLVSSRSGTLVSWTFSKFEKDSPEESRAVLLDSLRSTAVKMIGKINETDSTEVRKKDSPVDTFPDLESPDRRDYRPPLPFRRLKPKYTDLASLYDILATVDVAVEFDRHGKVIKTEILRWAGFGLDESVIETVKKMHWRPGERNGKPLPMRVLLRYNFKNIDTDK